MEFNINFEEQLRKSDNLQLEDVLISPPIFDFVVEDVIVMKYLQKNEENNIHTIQYNFSIIDQFFKFPWHSENPRRVNNIYTVWQHFIESLKSKLTGSTRPEQLLIKEISEELEKRIEDKFKKIEYKINNVNKEFVKIDKGEFTVSKINNECAGIESCGDMNEVRDILQLNYRLNKYAQLFGAYIWKCNARRHDIERDIEKIEDNIPIYLIAEENGNNIENLEEKLKEEIIKEQIIPKPTLDSKEAIRMMMEAADKYEDQEKEKSKKTKK